MKTAEEFKNHQNQAIEPPNEWKSLFNSFSQFSGDFTNHREQPEEQERERLLGCHAEALLKDLCSCHPEALLKDLCCCHPNKKGQKLLVTTLQY